MLTYEKIVAVIQSHLFLKISQKNTGRRVLRMIKLQNESSKQLLYAKINPIRASLRKIYKTPGY